MKTFTSITFIIGLTVLAAACAKHAIPKYYDSKGHEIAFKQYKATVLCNAPLAFNPSAEVTAAAKKYVNSQSYFVRTYLVSDSQALSTPAAAIKNGDAKAASDVVTDEAKENVAAINQQDNFLANYPVDNNVSDMAQALDDNKRSNGQEHSQNLLLVNKDCQKNMATYVGPGSAESIKGPIVNPDVNSIEIEGNETSPAAHNQQVHVKVERLIPDGTSLDEHGKSKKGAAVIAKDRDQQGLYSFQITLERKSKVGSRTLVFRQDIVDDVISTVTISRDLAQVYSKALNGSGLAGQIDAAINAAVKAAPNKKTVDIDIALLKAAREAISKQNAPAPTSATPATDAAGEAAAVAGKPAANQKDDAAAASEAAAKKAAEDEVAAYQRDNDAAVSDAAAKKAAEDEVAANQRDAAAAASEAAAKKAAEDEIAAYQRDGATLTAQQKPATAKVTQTTAKAAAAPAPSIWQRIYSALDSAADYVANIGISPSKN